MDKPINFQGVGKIEIDTKRFDYTRSSSRRQSDSSKSTVSKEAKAGVNAASKEKEAGMNVALKESLLNVNDVSKEEKINRNATSKTAGDTKENSGFKHKMSELTEKLKDAVRWLWNAMPNAMPKVDGGKVLDMAWKDAKKWGICGAITGGTVGIIAGGVLGGITAGPWGGVLGGLGVGFGGVVAGGLTAGTLGFGVGLANGIRKARR